MANLTAAGVNVKIRSTRLAEDRVFLVNPKPKVPVHSEVANGRTRGNHSAQVGTIDKLNGVA